MLTKNKAGLVKWYNICLPSRGQEFDSPIPHYQYKIHPTGWFLYCSSAEIKKCLNSATFDILSVMAKLYFTYAAMNAGKSTSLLQVAHNYQERGMVTYLITAEHDNRSGTRKISSRLGIEKDAHTYNKDTDLYIKILSAHTKKPLHCILIDEAQWLTNNQVKQLAEVVDTISVPVMCYGLRTDFQGSLFSGSQALLAIADELRELRTICHCGRKATMVLRLDGEGNVLKEGPQTQVGGNETYQSVCRKHWREAMEE